MGSRQKIYGGIGAFLLSFGAGGQAWAATYYVATNGSDSNAGSEAAPFKTIARGSKALNVGDTLYIRAGTYAEAMRHGQDGFVFRSGTSKSSMTRYAAYPGEERRVIVKPLNQINHMVDFGGTSFIELSGLVLDGTHASNYDAGYGSKGYVVSLQYVKNIRLLNNEIRYGRMGIKQGGGNEIIGNEIHHMRAYGIYTGEDSGLMEGNIFHDCGAYAIHHFQQYETVNNWVFRNNILYNNGRGYYFRRAPGAIPELRKTDAVIIGKGNGNKFYNNLVYNNHAGILVGYGSSDALVANNTIYGNETWGMQISSSFSGSTNTRVTNNISWGNGGQQIIGNGTNTKLENNLTTDPRFVNAGGYDFGVQAGSPAIDKGVALAEVPTDFTGKARPEGAAYDIGAFEGAGSHPNPTPSTVGGLPGGIGGGPVLLGPNGEVCYSGY